MEELLTNIGAILTSIVNWFGQIGSYLITNPIFIIILSIGIFSVLVTLIIGLIKSIKNKRDYNEWKTKYAENDNQMREEEDNYIEDFGRW